MRRSVLSTALALCVIAVTSGTAVSADPGDLDEASISTRVADAQALREAAGLRATREIVVESFEGPGFSMDAAGIPLTPSEADEFRAVLARQQALAPVAEQAARSTSFAGSYFRASTLIVRTSGDAAKLREDLLPLVAEGGLEVVAAEYSQRDLQSFLSRLDPATLPLGRGERVKSLWIDPELNRVAVGVIGIDEGRAAQIALELGPMAVVVPEEAGVNGGLYACTIANCGTRGGVKIVNGPRSCTAAFLVRRKDTGARYMLTAGHCIDWTSDTVNWKNGTGSITWGKNANFEFKNSAGTVIKNDLGVFRLGGVVPSAWNQYALATNPTGEASTISITANVPSSQVDPGRIFCRNGITSGWDCGVVQRGPIYITLSDSTIYSTVFEMKLKSAHGDSGAGFVEVAYSTYRAMGVLSGGEDRGGVSYTYFHPIEWGISGAAGFWPIEACTTSGC